jgi:multidrug resistance efflux pump
MLKLHLLLCGFVVLAGYPVFADDESKPATSDEIVVERAQVSLIEEVNIPARRTGVIQEVEVKAGATVEPGTALAKLDDTEAQLAEIEAATELAKARELAASDVEITAAKKARDVAQAELQRALEAVERYSKAISRTELDRLRLLRSSMPNSGRQNTIRHSSTSICTLSVRRLAASSSNGIISPASGSRRARRSWNCCGSTVYVAKAACFAARARQR